MDTDLQQAKRTGDPVAELTALTRMPALRGLPPCRHCGRDLSAVDLGECPSYEDTWSHSDDGCPRCNGTGRTEWSWHGDGGRLALMAYAGDEAARALGVECVHAVTAVRLAEFNPDRWPLSDWLRGLARWPGALLGAGILAGRAVLRTLEGEPTPGGGVVTAEARLALDAATEHHHCGCAASREAWWQADPLGGLGRPDWLVHPGELRGDPTWRIQAAIEATDEPTIRAAICAGLTGWARTGVL